MKKIFLMFFCASLLIFSWRSQSFAEENIDYNSCYQVTTPHIKGYEKSNTLVVLDNNEKPLFYMNCCADTVYSNEDVNIYYAPNKNTRVAEIIPKNSSIFRAAWSSNGWMIVQVEGQNYFVRDDNILTEANSGVEYNAIESISQFIHPQPVNIASTNNNYYYYGNGGEQMPEGMSAKEWIAWKESRGNYNVVSSTGKYIGKYQLTANKLNGDYSPENQERVADQYVSSTYGSWEAAKQHWINYGWY